jgi:hypothetical protein
VGGRTEYNPSIMGTGLPSHVMRKISLVCSATTIRDMDTARILLTGVGHQ